MGSIPTTSTNYGGQSPWALTPMALTPILVLILLEAILDDRLQACQPG